MKNFKRTKRAELAIEADLKSLAAEKKKNLARFRAPTNSIYKRQRSQECAHLEFFFAAQFCQPTSQRNSGQKNILLWRQTHPKEENFTSSWFWLNITLHFEFVAFCAFKKLITMESKPTVLKDIKNFNVNAQSQGKELFFFFLKSRS